jgi:hypothetical protein
VEKCAEVVEILLPERPIETELMQELRVPLRRNGTFASEKKHGIAGQEPYERERDDGDADERRNDHRESMEDEPQHDL